MFREIVNSSITFANPGIVIGGHINPAVNGLTVYGDISATGNIYGGGGGGGGGGGSSLPPIASIGDVIKATENSSVSAWSSGRVSVEELTAQEVPKDGAIVTFSELSGRFSALLPEFTPAQETSYIKKLGKCSQCRVFNSIDLLGYAAITTDNRVISWGWLPGSRMSTNFYGDIFYNAPLPTPTTIPASENVRIPFWDGYNGYLSGADYRPYGGDFFDKIANQNKSLPINQQKKYIIDDLYWSRHAAMCLVSAADEIGGDVWVAGANTAGPTVGAANPNALVKTKFGSYLIANEIGAAADTNSGGIYLLNPERDICAIQKYTAVKTRDIIEDKTNSTELSTDSFYWVTDDTNVKKINHFGESLSSFGGFGTPTGLAMVQNTIGLNGQPNRNLLYVCDVNKIKVYDITTGFSVLSSIGSVTSWTSNPTDGATDASIIQFKNLRKIDSHPNNPDILYVSDEHVIRRLWRKGNGHWKVNTITNTVVGDLLGTCAIGSPTTKLKKPNGIKVNSNGDIFVGEQGNKKLIKISVTTNDENNFSGNATLHVSDSVQTPATFNTLGGFAKDGINNIYVCDTANHIIRKIEYDSTKKTYGKVTSIGVLNGAAATPGTFTDAKFKSPTGICYSSYDNALYVTNKDAHVISKIDLTSSTISIVAGTVGSADNVNGSGTTSKFSSPVDIAYGEYGASKLLFVADFGKHCIRMIDITSPGIYNVTTPIGVPGNIATTAEEGNANSVKLKSPYGLYYFNNELYFTHFNCVQKYILSTGRVQKVAGSHNLGTTNATGALSLFNSPRGITVSGSDMFVSDYGNYTIRRIKNFSSAPSSNIVDTPAGNTKAYRDGIATNSRFTSLNFLFKNDDDILISDSNLLRSLYNVAGTFYVKTINGKETAGSANTTTQALDIEYTGLYIDKKDNVSFADYKADSIGEESGGKVELIRRMVAGSLGIGEAFSNVRANVKGTNGFIKVNATDHFGNSYKFKKIQFKGETENTILFAALDTEDSLWLWGYSVDGAFGTGQHNTVGPTKIYQFEKNVKDFQITASMTGVSLISVVTKDKKLYSAGDNTNYQLGNGSITAASKIFKQCKKNASTFVGDAEKIIVSDNIGNTNNLYISDTKEVWACGLHTGGILGNGSTPPAGHTANKLPYFQIITGIDKVVYLMGATNNSLNHIVFALKENGELWSWGYNTILGQALVNDTVTPKLFYPTQTYNFDTRGPVTNAKYIFCNDNPGVNQSMIGYLTDDGDFYIGGFSTGAGVPDMPKNIPYFAKFNMRNVNNDVILLGKDAVVRRSNGTVYKIDDYGAKKVF